MQKPFTAAVTTGLTIATMAMTAEPAAAYCNSVCRAKCAATWQYNPRYRGVGDCIADWAKLNENPGLARQIERQNAMKRRLYRERMRGQR